MKRRSFLKALGAILPASLFAGKASAEDEPGPGFVSDNDWAVITEPDLSGPKYIVTSKNHGAKAREILGYKYGPVRYALARGPMSRGDKVMDVDGYMVRWQPDNPVVGIASEDIQPGETMLLEIKI